MTIEDQITALLAEAAPLRCLPQDDPAALPLAGIIDEINRLRAIQAGAPVRAEPAPPEHDPEAPVVLAHDAPLPKRRPGRPKATPEGADA